ncbi:MAG: RagB/SusD family nutrient uptake outer membrane protein [Bacteroidota bacterium]|nr:RagB/SusD family nutrient uptake outer membrane protein [Bacteroidota bacterium]
MNARDIKDRVQNGHRFLTRKTRRMKAFKYFFAVLLLSGFCYSCIDTESLEVLDESDHYQNLADAQKSVIGLYGKVMGMAEQLVVLNELHADLMDVTTNADQDLQDISNFTSNADNPWTNPVPFYSVIQNCNDMLAHFDLMLANHQFTKDQYNEFYSDVMTVRCWTYFQVGTLFGKIPYLTKPIKSLKDVGADQSSYIGLDELISNLITCMENLPTLNQYTSVSGMANKRLGNYNLDNYYINKRCLLSELYLWTDDQYYKAAKTIRDFHIEGGTEETWKRYKTISYVYQGTFEGAYMVTYTRYLWNDINSLVNLWVNMFQLGMNENWANFENITCMTYDPSYTPTYPFIRLMGTQGVGKYLLKPSANAIDNYWGAQVQTNGFTFDGRGEGGSYEMNGQQPVITKYLHSFDANAPYEQSGKWFIYRAGWLNLLYAEACNRYAETPGYVDGDQTKPYSAYRRLTNAFLNTSLSAEFNFTRPDGTTYPADSVAVSGWGAGKEFPYPFYFDARYSTTPYHRGYWRDHSGIRNRASLTSVTYDSTATVQPEVRFYEKAILDELALETAYEGHRWRDILRIARRWNREKAGTGTALLNQVIGAKFAKNGKSAPVFLDNESNWYLPVNFQ